MPYTGALADEAAGTQHAGARTAAPLACVTAGDVVVRFSEDLAARLVKTRGGVPVQRLTMSATDPRFSFQLIPGRSSAWATAGRSSTGKAPRAG